MNAKDAKNLKDFDKFLTENCARPEIAADRLSCIMGVIIDIKPSCIIDFNLDDAKNMDMKKFEKFLKDLGLKFYYEKTDLGEESFIRFTHTYFISKTAETLDLIVDAERELYDHFDENEPNSPVIKIIHRKIGRLLGYPETATDWFLIRTEKMDLDEMDKDEYMKDLQKYHHFIHSRTNDEEEFIVYDRPIHAAMEKYTPLSAKLLRESKPEKRWL
ncbi:hypothetical protein IJ768_00020 [Candidatus Saccharibacteria bacterium]|nr:hypothetical protein [Candidatus Saccharibacteria bacterium]